MHNNDFIIRKLYTYVSVNENNLPDILAIVIATEQTPNYLPYLFSAYH